MIDDKPWKDGDDWYVWRDPDEKSRYLADITQELIDRATTALDDNSEAIELILAGVVSLEPPEIRSVEVAGEVRTYVVAFLGGTGTEPPEDWRWEARVNCKNGEQFDKTTHFKRRNT